MRLGDEHRRVYGDRFIPMRTTAEYHERQEVLSEIIDAQSQEHASMLEDEKNSQCNTHSSQRMYQTLLHNQVLGIQDPCTIHQLGQSAHLMRDYPYSQRYALLHDHIADTHNCMTTIHGLDKENEGCALPTCCGFTEEDHRLVRPPTTARKIPQAPYKVLDAPALKDDFYLNVVAWSSQGVLSVGLGSSVYLWTPQCKVVKLADVPSDDSVTSISWSLNGSHLAIGTYKGAVQLWDTCRNKLLRTLKGHDARVGCIAWNSSILSTGSRDKSIMQSDLRERADGFAWLRGHKQEVCGLQWAPDEQHLASGGNDNKLLVWDAQGYDHPSARFTNHTAAVRALAWSPHHHGMLVSGGGTADRCIRSWNTLTNTEVACTDTGSQVCSLLFSSRVDELVSSHGYSQNSIFVWRYPEMRKLATLSGHSSRVLYLASSNDGESIVSGAGDETLRFWRVFPKDSAYRPQPSLLVPSCRDLR
jgi:WD40 repeat protein